MRKGQEKVRVPSGWMYFYPKCIECGKSKGKSSSPTCMNCRGGPRKGMHLKCPHCDATLDRNAIIVSLYNSGFSYRQLAKLFTVSHGTIGYVVRKWESDSKLRLDNDYHM